MTTSQTSTDKDLQGRVRVRTIDGEKFATVVSRVGWIFYIVRHEDGTAEQIRRDYLTQA